MSGAADEESGLILRTRRRKNIRAIIISTRNTRPPATDAPTTTAGGVAPFTLERAPLSPSTGVTVPVTLAGAFKGVNVPAAALVGVPDCVLDDVKVPDCEFVSEPVTLDERVGVTDGEAPLEIVAVGEGVEDEVILEVGSFEGVEVPITLEESVGVTDILDTPEPPPLEGEVDGV